MGGYDAVKEEFGLFLFCSLCSVKGQSFMSANMRVVFLSKI